MGRQIPAGEAVIDQFPIWEHDGYTKKTGETVFTVMVWLDGVVQAAIIPTVSEIGTSGEYKIEFQPDNTGFWTVEVLIDYNKDIWFGEYDAATGSIQDIYDVVMRIAGLSHENIFIDNTSYDADGQLISARVRLFDSGTNCDLATDGGSETTGMIASYTLNSVWDLVNQFQTFKQVRDV